MKMLTEVLSIRLREVLREDMSGVYGSWESGSISRRPIEQRRFSVSFGCSPDNVDKLAQAVMTEARTIAKSGIDAKYIEKIKNARLRTREVDLEENSFWRRELHEAYWYGDDPREILTGFRPMVDKISSERVRAAARKYLAEKQYVLGVLRPEK